MSRGISKGYTDSNQIHTTSNIAHLSQLAVRSSARSPISSCVFSYRLVPILKIKGTVYSLYMTIPDVLPQRYDDGSLLKMLSLKQLLRAESNCATPLTPVDVSSSSTDHGAQ